MPDPGTNILLIQVDQMNAGCLSLLGNRNVRTPNLDRLATEGVLFTDASCNNPTCLPSRLSMLSGQYVSTLKQFSFNGMVDNRTPWLPEILRQAGYATGAFGKFHVDSIGENRWGFELAAPDLPEDDDFARPRNWTYENHCRENGIEWPPAEIHGHIPFDRAAKRRPTAADPDAPAYLQMATKSDVPLEHIVERWETDQCLTALEQWRTGDRPFFAWLSYHRPHTPTPLPEPWYSRQRPDELVFDRLPTAEELATWPRQLFSTFVDGPSRPHIGEGAFRRILASYFALIEFIDDEIGRVLQRLDDTGLAECTTVVFTADHGDAAGQLGLYDKFRIFGHSESITRVPLIIRPASRLGIAAAGRRIETPVELVDLTPTLLALHRLDVPAGMEGRNLSSLLAGGENAPSRPVFCEEYHLRVVRQNGWRLAYDWQYTTECSLVDLAADPLAYRNLYASPDPDVRSRCIGLKRQLFSFLMQRLHGPFDDDDVARVRKGLCPDDPTLPVRFGRADGPEGEHAVVCSFRSAACIALGTHFLLVPHYDDPMRLFLAARGAYQQTSDAVPVDPAIVEPMLDAALRQLCMAQHPNGGAGRFVDQPAPVTTAEAAEALRPNRWSPNNRIQTTRK